LPQVLPAEFAAKRLYITGQVFSPGLAVNQWRDLNHAVSKIKLQGDRYATGQEKPGVR